MGNRYSYKVVLTCYDGSKITSGTVSVAVTLDTAEILNIYSADAKKVKIKWLAKRKDIRFIVQKVRNGK